MAQIASLSGRVDVSLDGHDWKGGATFEVPITADLDPDGTATIHAAPHESIRAAAAAALLDAAQALLDTIPDAETTPAELPHRMIGSPLDIDPSPGHRAALDESRTWRREAERSDIADGPHHVIVGERQEGKTHLALRWLTEAPEDVERVLVVPTERMVDHLRRAAGFKYRDPRIISVRQLRNEHAGGRPGVEYGIDETVEVLTRALGLRQTPRLLTICTGTDWQN